MQSVEEPSRLMLQMHLSSLQLCLILFPLTKCCRYTLSTLSVMFDSSFSSPKIAVGTWRCKVAILNTNPFVGMREISTNCSTWLAVCLSLYTGKGYGLSVENIHKYMWVCVIGLLCLGGEAKAQNVRPMRLLLEWIEFFWRELFSLTCTRQCKLQGASNKKLVACYILFLILLTCARTPTFWYTIPILLTSSLVY